MYHRFEENKYPSTNIKILDFKKQLEIIRQNNIKFINPKKFEEELVNNKKKRVETFIIITLSNKVLIFPLKKPEQ